MPSEEPFSKGEGSQTCKDIRIDQMRIEPDKDGVLQETVVADGGTYTLDVEFKMAKV